jgi:hypothetical protein
VQEMMQFLGDEDEQLYHECFDDVSAQSLMCVSTAAQGKQEVEQTMRISVTIQGANLNMLIDSGSNHSFLNLHLQDKFQAIQQVSPIPIKITDGHIIFCTT